jgi:hypothetical protein
MKQNTARKEEKKPMKMKKLIVGLVVGAMVATSVATTAFAAKSPSTDKVTPTTAPSKSGGSKSSGSGKSSSGKSSSSKSSSSKKTTDPATLASNITGEIIKYDDQDVSSPAILKALSESTIASAKALGTGGILKAVDCEDSANPNGKGTLYQDTITVKFKSSAFKNGMKITVLHLPDGSSTWEKHTPDSVSNGECIVTLPSLSPVVFTAEGISDKTGEGAPVLPIAAAICLAGVVFFGTKIKFAK